MLLEATKVTNKNPVRTSVTQIHFIGRPISNYELNSQINCVRKSQTKYNSRNIAQFYCQLKSDKNQKKKNNIRCFDRRRTQLNLSNFLIHPCSNHHKICTFSFLLNAQLT